MHGRGVLFPEPAAWLTAYLLVLMFEGYKSEFPVQLITKLSNMG